MKFLIHFAQSFDFKASNLLSTVLQFCLQLVDKFAIIKFSIILFQIGFFIFYCCVT